MSSFLSKIPQFTFYYVLPPIMGFSAGLLFRDYYTFDINKKITIILADYYESIDEKPDKMISREYPEVIKLLKRIGK